MPSPEVLSIISSLDGGFNGGVPSKQIGVEIVSDTEAIYTLIHWIVDEQGRLVEKIGIEKYRLTLEQMEAELEPEPETEAFMEPQPEQLDSL